MPQQVGGQPSQQQSVITPGQAGVVAATLQGQAPAPTTIQAQPAIGHQQAAGANPNIGNIGANLPAHLQIASGQQPGIAASPVNVPASGQMHAGQRVFGSDPAAGLLQAPVVQPTVPAQGNVAVLGQGAPQVLASAVQPTQPTSAVQPTGPPPVNPAIFQQQAAQVPQAFNLLSAFRDTSSSASSSSSGSDGSLGCPVRTAGSFRSVKDFDAILFDA